MKCGSVIEDKHLGDWAVSYNSCSLPCALLSPHTPNTIFIWKNNWPMNYSFADRGIYQTVPEKWTVISGKTSDSIYC